MTASTHHRVAKLNANVRNKPWATFLSLFLLSERQKLFVRDFAVFHLIDSHFGHLHSFLGSFLGHVHIELHHERIPGYKRPADLVAVHFEIFLPPIRFSTHLIKSTHFCWHIFHRVRFDADDVFSIEIVHCLHPFAFAAIVHQFCCYCFCTIHSTSLFLIKNCSTDICVTSPIASLATATASRLLTRLRWHR